MTGLMRGTQLVFLRFSDKIETMSFTRVAALAHLRKLKKALYTPKEFVLDIGE